MINVLEPENELLKQFVDSIYILKKSVHGLEYTAYPTANIPVALLRNATVSTRNGVIHLENSNTPNHFTIACNQLSSIAHLQYPQLVDEISINFKPLGFPSYTRSKPENNKIFPFHEWDIFLPDLFQIVFETENQEQQLSHIEHFLLEQYVPLPDEAILLKVLELLTDTAKDYSIIDIANITGVHYKKLYRKFVENVGCSPMHYRKLIKFRKSVISKFKKGNDERMVDLCYTFGYTDQPYFTKQFKKLTGEKPSHFFKKVTPFRNNKVIFKIH